LLETKRKFIVGVKPSLGFYEAIKRLFLSVIFSVLDVGFINQKLKHDFSSEEVFMPNLSKAQGPPNDAKSFILKVHRNGFTAFIKALRNG